MKLITRQTKANEAYESWCRQYRWRADDITGRLKALGPNPDPDAVDAAIGNDTWTRVDRCDECDCQKDVVVQLGEPPEIESSTAWICVDCLRAALKLAEGT